jgi:ankyrin repeat protein
MCRSLALFFIATFISQALAAATIHTVPDDYPSIQAAIDAASAGDMVVVKQGTYTEALQLKDGVSLEGEDRERVVVQQTANNVSALCVSNTKTGSVTGITFLGMGNAEDEAKVIFPGPVVVMSDSDVEFINCAIRNGRRWGAVVYRGAPTLDACLIENNGLTGVYCYGGETRPTIKRCEIRGNLTSGVSFYGEGMSAIAFDNVALDNGWYGFNVGEKVSVQGHKNDYTRNKVFSYRELGWLYWNKEFGYLETIVKRLREEKPRYDNGNWQLEYFYDCLSDKTSRMSPQQEEDFMSRMDAWKSEFPDSLTWRIVLARAYYNRAWALRGSGFAHTVTSKGWEGYHKNMRQAWDVMDGASAIDPKDPEYYCLLAELAMEAPRETASQSRSLVSGLVRAIVSSKAMTPKEEAFLAGTELEPLYTPLYTMRVRHLLPRWGGSKREMVRFAEESADRTKDLAGEMMYALVASKVTSYEGEEEFLSYGFSWERIAQGYERFLEDFPQTDFHRTRYAWLACIHRDQTRAAEMLERIANAGDESLWGDEAQFRAYKDWALGNGPYPELLPIVQAIVDGDSGEVQRLLDTGTDPETRVTGGESLLILAIRYDRYRICEQLLIAGADPNYVTPYGDFALYQAVGVSQPQYLNLLVRHHVNPNQTTTNGWTPLMSTIYWEHPEFAKILLDAGADPNLGKETNKSALILAVQHQYVALVQLLLENEADPNFQSKKTPPALFAAVDLENVALCKMLLEHGADPNIRMENGSSVLTKAIQEENPGLVTLLLERGADPALKPPNEHLPLGVAARLGNLEICQILIDRGAEPDQREPDNWSAVFAVAYSNNVDIAHLLVERGAEVNVRIPDGWSAFHRAAKYNADAVLSYFLECNPDGIHYATEGGRTLLHEAARAGHTEIVRLCIERGLDVNAAEKDTGKTALQYALDLKRDDIATVLREHGANR